MLRVRTRLDGGFGAAPSAHRRPPDQHSAIRLTLAIASRTCNEAVHRLALEASIVMLRHSSSCEAIAKRSSSSRKLLDIAATGGVATTCRPGDLRTERRAHAVCS